MFADKLQTLRKKLVDGHNFEDQNFSVIGVSYLKIHERSNLKANITRATKIENKNLSR